MSGTRITARPESAELVVERTFAASAARLWRCWTTPEVARWWGPRGWRAVVHEMDVRPGGTWRYSIAPQDGGEPPVECVAVYRRVREPVELAFDDGAARRDGQLLPGTDVPVTVAIRERPGGTDLTITTRFRDAAHLATARAGGMDTGFAEALDRLAEHVHPTENRTDPGAPTWTS